MGPWRSTPVTPHLGHRCAAYRPRLRLVHLGQLSAASPAGQASRVTPVTIALIEGHNASYGSRLSLRVRAPRNRVARMGSRLGVLPRFLRTVVRVWAFVLLVALRNLSGVDVGLDVLPRSSAPPTGLGSVAVRPSAGPLSHVHALQGCCAPKSATRASRIPSLGQLHHRPSNDADLVQSTNCVYPCQALLHRVASSSSRRSRVTEGRFDGHRVHD